jgi:hypothetical protein
VVIKAFFYIFMQSLYQQKKMNIMKKILPILLLVFFSVFAKSQAHYPPGAINIIPSLRTTFTNNDPGLGISPDVNIALILFNVGYSSNFTASREPEHKFYVGMGFSHYIQLQYGRSLARSLVRLRSDMLVLGNGLYSPENIQKNYEKILLTLSVEMDFDDPSQTMLSIGIGYLIFQH